MPSPSWIVFETASPVGVSYPVTTFSEDAPLTGVPGSVVFKNIEPLTAVIGAGGLLVVTFDKTVHWGADGPVAGWELRGASTIQMTSPIGGGQTSGGLSTLTFIPLTDPVFEGEYTLHYAQPGDGVQNAFGSLLHNVHGFPVTNNIDDPGGT